MTVVPRCWLFTPGSRPDRFPKAVASEADALILDLEDAVAEGDKALARAHVLGFIRNRPPIRQQICVRINPLTRAAGLEDLAGIASLPEGPEYILVPKAEEPAELALAGRVLADAGSATRIVALVESARGVVAAPALAQSTPRMAALLFGAADYAADLGQQVGAYQPIFARQSIVNAAAAGGIAAIDSPSFAINDLAALATECADVRAMGFAGKAAIHPLQIDPIRTAFAPTPDEVALAHRILEAAPEGVGVLDGKMIDVAMVRWARRIA